MRDEFSEKAQNIAKAGDKAPTLFTQALIDNQEFVEFARNHPEDATWILRDAFQGFIVQGDKKETSANMWKALMAFVQSKTALAMAEDVLSDRNVASLVSDMQGKLIGNDKEDFAMFLPMTSFVKALSDNPRATIKLAGNTSDPRNDLAQLLTMLKR